MNPAATPSSPSSAAPDPLPARRPTWRFLLEHPAHGLALGFGSGLPRLAPGTWGTLAAWVLFLWLDQWLDTAGWWTLIAALLALGAWSAQVTGRALGPDAGHIVIDEIVAFWIVLVVLPPAGGLALQALAFLLFRLFDILKPPPIRFLDQRLNNGVGVMLDDLAAAFYALLAIALATRIAA